jgi:hypothetical protein
MVVILKPGKLLYDTPKVFCPIILLNTLGKLFEKMLFNRLQFKAAEYGVLHPNQLGGFCQNSTKDAGCFLTLFFLFFFFFCSTFYNATVHNTCIAYLRQSLQVIGDRGEGLYEGQSDVTLGDCGCGTQPQRTCIKDTGYGRPVRAKLCQGVGPQPRWLRRRRRSRVALNRSGNPT